ncbi:hypothetical protein AURDEDRAFT_133003 [Auricularia subglabra TFB-10046 SS5]|nr:hypothetical protein AURDEDRAFT_133003 [Auricularia subglabra TFB-10046 SS5]
MRTELEKTPQRTDTWRSHSHTSIAPPDAAPMGIEEDAAAELESSTPVLQEEIPGPLRLHPFSLSVLAPLAPASMFGVLARLGLLYLGTYAGQSAFSLAWVQWAGCFFMGVFLGLRDTITGIYPPMYTALTTGFCGSLTTFSSWQVDVFLAWANRTDLPRSRLHTFMDGLTRLAFTLALSLAALSFGIHIASYHTVASIWGKWKPRKRRAHVLLDLLWLAMYAATIPAYILLPHAYRPMATSALLYSFPGTLIRYALGTRLNRGNFPYGTFTANSLGSALLAGFHALEHSRSGVGIHGCEVLQGLSDGFCGCLTTVSTFAVEIRAALGGRSWTYALTSIIVAQALCLAILGPTWLAGAVDEKSPCSA